MRKTFILIIAVALMAGCSPKIVTTPSEVPNQQSSSSQQTPAVVKTGTASIITTKGTNVKEGKEGTAQSEVTMCTVSLDANDKITFVSFDAAQIKFAFNDKGELTTDLVTTVKTKKEIGKDYGMAKISGIGKEWDEQVVAYEKWLIGKTLDEATNMKKVSEDTAVPDVAELKTSVTIGVAPYIEVLTKAVSNAK